MDKPKGTPHPAPTTVRQLVGLMIAVVLAIGVAGCEKKPVDTPPDPLLMEGDVEIVRDVVLMYSDSLRLRARVEGPKLVKYLKRQEEKEEFPEGVKVIFYEPDGSESGTLIADFGIRDPRKKRIKGIGNVVFHNPAGEKLETEELIWDEENDRVFTRKFVLFTTPEEKVWGMGFEANQDFSFRRIFAPEGRVILRE